MRMSFAGLGSLLGARLTQGVLPHRPRIPGHLFLLN